jgi:hypothetical protein
VAMAGRREGLEMQWVTTRVRAPENTNTLTLHIVRTKEKLWLPWDSGPVTVDNGLLLEKWDILGAARPALGARVQ